MSRIFVTGDTHGMIDIEHILKDEFPIGQQLTREDYVIVAGDFGLLFYTDQDKAKMIREVIEKLPFTVLWIDGNHENFDLIAKYPTTYWNGGNIQKILDNCYHLLRGQYYEIDGRTFFTFGGGCSIDRFMRKEGVSWWKDEIPNKNEMDEGIYNLGRHNNKVDYIITHAAPAEIMKRYFGGSGYNYEPSRAEIPLGRYFDFLLKNIEYKKWFHGHLHLDDLEKHSDLGICQIYKVVVELE